MEVVGICSITIGLELSSDRSVPSSASTDGNTMQIDFLGLTPDRGDVLTMVYSEKLSAKTIVRPELDRLRADARAGLIRRVYLYRLDRLARDLSLIRRAAGICPRPILRPPELRPRVGRRSTRRRSCASRRRARSPGRSDDGPSPLAEHAARRDAASFLLPRCSL